jgi:hypothetical protein
VSREFQAQCRAARVTKDSLIMRSDRKMS